MNPLAFDSVCDQYSILIFGCMQDEMLWAAAWLHRATDEKQYLNYLSEAGDIGGTRTTFSCMGYIRGVLAAMVRTILNVQIEQILLTID